MTTLRAHSKAVGRGSNLNLHRPYMGTDRRAGHMVQQQSQQPNQLEESSDV